MQVFPNMNIHCDLVTSRVTSDVWIDYDIDYDNLANVKYLGIDTYAPNKKDTRRILTEEYGCKYMIPDNDREFTDRKQCKRIYKTHQKL